MSTDIDLRLPSALSNTENKLLEESIELKSKELTNLQNQHEENLDRIQMIEEYQKMIEEELRSIQRLLNACQTEENTEKSYVNIYLIERERLEKMINNAENDLQNYLKQKNRFQKEIDQLNSQITKINHSARLDKEEFEKYVEVIKKRDEESFALMKYTREDNTRIKELTFELNRLSERLLQLKRSTDEELIDYSSYQFEFDKIAEQFRRSYSQRQQLIQRWESILQQLQHKDQDIHLLSQKLIEIKRQKSLKEEELFEQKKFYDHEQKANLILKKFIQLENQKFSSLKSKEKSIDDKHQTFETDICSIKILLTNTENQLQRERISVQQLQTDIRKFHLNLIKLKHRHQRILNRKSSIINAKLSIEDKLNKFENLMLNEEKYQQTLTNQYKKFEKKYISIQNQFYSHRQHEKDYERMIQAYKNQLNHYQNQIIKYDQQLFKQQEMIYHQDFLKQNLDRHLNEIVNEKTREKIDESEIKLHELQIEHEKKKKQFNQIENQMKILNDELRILKRDYQQLTHEKQDFQEKFLQFDLSISLSEKSIQKLNTQKEDFLIEEHLLHIELKRLKALLHQSSTMNCNLEQQQIDIQKSIKERRMEVQANCHLFQIRFNDERTKKLSISTELAMKVKKIEKLKHRYETTLNSDEENILHQTHYVIQSAQMKEELLRQGDQLQGLIIKSEKELKALENTVQILKSNNKDIKKNFEKLNSSDPEILLIKELEEHLRAVSEQVKIRQKMLKDFSENKQSIDTFKYENEIKEINEKIAEKSRLQSKLQDEIQQYQMKINRVDQYIKRMKNIDINQFDIDVRLLHQTNEKLEQQFISFCSNINDQTFRNTFEQLSKEYNWQISLNPSKKLPTRPSSSTINFIPNVVNISIEHSLSKRS